MLYLNILDYFYFYVLLMFECLKIILYRLLLCYKLNFLFEQLVKTCSKTEARPKQMASASVLIM